MTEAQIDREVKRRLTIFDHAEEVTGNVAMTCRYYGITRQTFYPWKRRYDELGEEGLRPRSTRPKLSPNATHVDVVGKIIYLRQNYHFGPAKIAMCLKRHDDVAISHSGVWRIRKRLEMNRLPSSQRYKRLDKRWHRYEKQLPWPSGPDRREVHRTHQGCPAQEVLPVHGHRRLHSARVLRIYPALNQKTAIQFVDYVFERLPFVVQPIQTDNGPEFGSSFHYHVLDKGVGHRDIKSRTPRLNGNGKDPIGSTPRSSTGCSTVPSSTTPRSSTTSSVTGRTTTTTIAPTAAWAARPPNERLQRKTKARV